MHPRQQLSLTNHGDHFPDGQPKIDGIFGPQINKAVRNYSIEQVINFNYLGVRISGCRNLKEDARYQVKKTASATGHLEE